MLLYIHNIRSYSHRIIDDNKKKGDTIHIFISITIDHNFTPNLRNISNIVSSKKQQEEKKKETMFRRKISR